MITFCGLATDFAMFFASYIAFQCSNQERTFPLRLDEALGCAIAHQHRLAHVCLRPAVTTHLNRNAAALGIQAAFSAFLARPGSGFALA